MRGASKSKTLAELGLTAYGGDVAITGLSVDSRTVTIR